MGEKTYFLEYHPLWYLTNMDTSGFPIAEPYPYEDENCIQIFTGYVSDINNVEASIGYLELSDLPIASCISN